MNIVFRQLIIAVVAIAASSCNTATPAAGSSKLVTRDLTVSEFTKIDAGGAIDVEITLAPGPAKAQLSGEENQLDNITITVENGALVIGQKHGVTIGPNRHSAKLVVTMPSVSALSLSGVCKAKIKGLLTGNNFSTDMSGAASVSADSLAVNNMSVQISGTGAFEVMGGKADTAAYQISGAGTVNVLPLETKQTSAEISGTGFAEVFATQQLHVDISGAGKVNYKGEPHLDKSVSGIGRVSHLN